jgi:hypothetical protein
MSPASTSPYRGYPGKAGQPARYLGCTRNLASIGASILIAAAFALAQTSYNGARGVSKAEAASVSGGSGLASVIVSWIAVSRDYSHTGTVVVGGAQTQCSASCRGVWISHDGGATWRRTTAHFSATRVEVGRGPDGREVILAENGAEIQRSEDGGATWTRIGAGGVVSLLPTFSQDAGLAVAAGPGPSDYVMHRFTPDDVVGSGGVFEDVQFGVSPSYPSGGGFSPVVAAGMDTRTGHSVIITCDASFVCEHSGVVLPQPADAWSTPNPLRAVVALADDYGESGTVFIDLPTGVFRSTDGGRSFTVMPIPRTPGTSGPTFPMIALAPGFRLAGPTRTVYAAQFDFAGGGTEPIHTMGGLYVSRNGGDSWQALATTGYFAGGAQAIAVAPDGRLFAGYSDGRGGYGVVCSIDQGSTWRLTCPPLNSVRPNALEGAQAPSAAGVAARDSRGYYSPAAIVLGAAMIAGLLAIAWRARKRLRMWKARRTP